MKSWFHLSNDQLIVIAYRQSKVQCNRDQLAFLYVVTKSAAFVLHSVFAVFL